MTTSRSVAMERDSKRYFTGLACPSGHIAQRFTANGRCVVCSGYSYRTWYRMNAKRVRAAHREWARKNPVSCRVHASKRRASVDRRMPVWADPVLIRNFYHLAAKAGMEVDHVYPLRGKLVSGLHVIENFQMLSSEENDRKHNSYPFGQPDAWGA